MPVSEAKKASNAAWDAVNMAYQTVKVRREILEEFRAACAARGDKVNTVLREAMEDYTAGTLQRNDAGSEEATLQRADDFMLPEEDRQKAQKAAEANGEELRAWIGRAITETAQRDEYARMLKR